MVHQHGQPAGVRAQDLRGPDEFAVANLARFYEAVGSKVSIIYISGTDFGTQRAPFISRKSYRNLYMPFLKEMIDWCMRTRRGRRSSTLRLDHAAAGRLHRDRV